MDTSEIETDGTGSRGRFRTDGMLRGLTAGAAFVTADVHLLLWYHDDFRQIPRVGPLFLLNAIAGAVLGVLVVAWRSWLAPALAAGYAATTLGAFYVSVTVGLLGLHETASGGPQLHAEVAEWVAVVAGVGAALPGALRALRARAISRRIPARAAMPRRAG